MWCARRLRLICDSLEISLRKPRLPELKPFGVLAWLLVLLFPCPLETPFRLRSQARRYNIAKFVPSSLGLNVKRRFNG